jgi:thiol-disulfide isomerase/thioredoxin
VVWKWGIIVRLKFVVLVLAAALTGGPAIAVTQGDVAPPWQGSDFNDAGIEFPALANGRPTVLVFWATWCGYCKAFMPYLASIQADYGSDRIEIVAVNAKERNGDPEAYIASLDFPVVAVRDGDSIAEAYDVNFIPGLMVIDGSGKVSWRRSWTELPAGKKVAELWSGQVREALDELF